MKKIIVCGAVLSLILLACGDDSSSTGTESGIDEIASSDAKSQPTSGETPESSDQEISSSSVAASSSSGESGSSSSSVLESSESVSSSSETASSSSETVSGSSMSEESSSSTSELPKQVVDNMSGSCQNSNSSDDPLLDGASVGGDQALPPVAYMTVKNDSATYLVENVMMACDQIGGFAGMTELLRTPTLEVTMDGTTMHVKPLVENASSSSSCICHAQFAFSIRLDSPFASATLLVLDDKNNVSNKMRIVTMTE